MTKFSGYVPMAVSVAVAATIRDMGSTEVPVAVVTFKDVLGDTWTIHLDADVSYELLAGLLRFYHQVKR
jgi:hypothetical protein